MYIYIYIYNIWKDDVVSAIFSFNPEDPGSNGAGISPTGGEYDGEKKVPYQSKTQSILGHFENQPNFKCLLIHVMTTK